MVALEHCIWHSRAVCKTTENDIKMLIRKEEVKCVQKKKSKRLMTKPYGMVAPFATHLDGEVLPWWCCWILSLISLLYVHRHSLAWNHLQCIFIDFAKSEPWKEVFKVRRCVKKNVEMWQVFVLKISNGISLTFQGVEGSSGIGIREACAQLEFPDVRHTIHHKICCF